MDGAENCQTIPTYTPRLDHSLKTRSLLSRQDTVCVHLKWVVRLDLYNWRNGLNYWPQEWTTCNTSKNYFKMFLGRSREFMEFQWFVQEFSRIVLDSSRRFYDFCKKTAKTKRNKCTNVLCSLSPFCRRSKNKLGIVGGLPPPGLPRPRILRDLFRAREIY